MTNYADTLDHNATMRRNPAQRAAITLRESGKGGVIAKHAVSGSEHEFGPEEGHLLAAHIGAHFGIKMPEVHGAPSEEPRKEPEEAA
jgi:imidazolonepropionase-like amidohydrolase